MTAATFHIDKIGVQRAVAFIAERSRSLSDTILSAR